MELPRGGINTRAEQVSLAREVESGRRDEQRMARLVHPVDAETLGLYGFIALIFYHRQIYFPPFQLGIEYVW